MGFNLGKALGGLTKSLGPVANFLGPVGTILGGLDAIKGFGKAGRGSDRLSGQMGDAAGIMGQFGQDGLSSFFPQYLSSLTPQDAPWLGQNPYIDAAKQYGLFDATTKQFGLGAGLANRYTGGAAGSSGFNSMVNNAAMRKGASDATGMRQLLIEGNREGYQRYLNFDRERQRRLEGLGNFSTGLMNQSLGHLGGLRGMYASDQKNYGSLFGQLGQGQGLGGLLGGKGQAGGSRTPGTTTSQRPTGGMQVQGGGFGQQVNPGYRQTLNSIYGGQL